jgi:hypothetical protein
MKETKNRKISARINETTYQIIKNSGYSLPEALEWFAGNLTNQDNRKFIQLKLLEDETEILKDKILHNEVKIMELQENLQDKGITGKEHNKPVMTAIHNTINYYERHEIKYNGLEDFLETESNYLNQTANRCSLKVEELKELVLNKYNEKLNQQTLM